MPLRPVKDPSPGSIPVRDLKNGQIGEIVEWEGGSEVGQLLRRCGSELLNLSENCGPFRPPPGDEYRVRVLPDGTELQIFDNE